jgi:hypothetical protein
VDRPPSDLPTCPPGSIINIHYENLFPHKTTRDP